MKIQGCPFCLLFSGRIVKIDTLRFPCYNFFISEKNFQTKFIKIILWISAAITAKVSIE